MFDSSIEFQRFMEIKIEKILDDIERKNLEYARYRMYSDKNCEKYVEIVSRLPEKERDFINEYGNNSYKMNVIERKEIYYRGYQDCMKFLKLFGMI